MMQPWASLGTRQTIATTLDRRQDQYQAVLFGNSSPGQQVYGQPQNGISGFSAQNQVMNFTQPGIMQQHVSTVPPTSHFMGYPSWRTDYVQQPQIYGPMTPAPAPFASFSHSYGVPQSYVNSYCYPPVGYQTVQPTVSEVPPQPPAPPKPKASRQLEIRDPETGKLIDLSDLKEQASSGALPRESLERGHAKTERPVVISERQQPAVAEQNLNGAGPVSADALNVRVTAKKPEVVDEDVRPMLESSKEVTSLDYVDNVSSSVAPSMPTLDESAGKEVSLEVRGKSAQASTDENATRAGETLAKSDMVEPRKLSDVSIERTRSDGTGKGDIFASADAANRKELLELIKQERARTPEMWSPTNCKGGKVYSRKFAFLIRHLDDNLKWRLPDECIVNRSLYDELRMQKDGLKSELRDDIIQFGHLRGNYRGRSSGGRIGSKKPSVPTRPSLPANVQLQKSENAWKPNWKRPRELSADSLQTQELYNNVRNVLNKLTPKNLTDMTEQFNEHIANADTDERMTGVVDIFFEKALSEPNYCNLYSQLCKSTYAAADQKKVRQFKTILLKRCQNEFENMGRAVAERKMKEEEIKNATSEEEKARMVIELEDFLSYQKRRRTGNISFIGELYKEGLLSVRIMIGCIGNLHKAGADEFMECLCKLLTSIGYYIENGPYKACDDDLERIDRLFRALPIQANMSTSSRIKFMILDLIDLRKNGYRPRRQELQPKNTDEIQREMENKQRALELQAEQLKLSSEGFRQRRPGGGSSGSRYGLFKSGSGQGGRSRSPMGGRLSSSAKGGGSSSYSRSSGSSRMEDRSPSYNMTKAIFYVQQGLREGTLRPHGVPSKFVRSDMNSTVPASCDVLAENRFALLGNADDGSFSVSDYLKSEPSSPESTRSRKGCNASKSDGRTTKLSKSAAPSAPTFGDVSSSVTQTVDQCELTISPIEEIYSILNDEQFKAFVCPLFDKDVSESAAEVKRSSHPERFVLVWCNHVIDGDSSSRRRLGNVLCSLIKKEAISQPAVRLGLINMVRYAMDTNLETDCPNLFSYFGDVIGSLLVSGGVRFVPSVPLLLPIVDIYGGIKGWRILANVLSVIKSLTSPSEVRDFWRQNNKLNEKLKSDLDEDAAKQLFESFVSLNSLSDLLKATDDVSLLTSSSLNLTERLVKLNDFVRTIEPVDSKEVIAFISRNFSNEEVLEEDFVGALIESMCSRSVADTDDGQRIFSKERFDKLVPVLESYIGNRPKAQSFALNKLTNLYVHLYECLQDMLVEMIKSCVELSAVTPDSVLELFAASEKNMEMGFVFKDGSMLHLKKSLLSRLYHDGDDERSPHLATAAASMSEQ
ncbi:eukaryotic translation initiation factor 4 [Trichuris trichiura]|uniref:Eukaryotic translation initiation factor 4 n=1 Tax=Trichuris trichiura TaxID=36087 RepID=A0A077ZIG8_TRITR|nr:eukaryotic translation initiation factor 4 [Trichuris trichiura]